MRQFVLAILFAWSCSFVQAQSPDCASLTQQALDATGFNRAIDEEVDKVNSEEFIRQLTEGKGDIPGFMPLFRSVLQKNFSAQTMKQELHDRVAAHCDPQQMTLTLQELHSPLMEQMIRLDAEARTPEGKQKLQRYARAIQVAPPSDERMSLIQSFDERTGVSAFAVDSMVASSRGMMAGLGAPPEAVVSQMAAHLGEIKAQIQKNVLLALSSTYRNMSRADLDAYAKELTAQPLKGFYDRVKKAFLEMMEARSMGIGKDLKVAIEARQK